MKIGIIGGTGGMGKGFALRFCKKHAVIIGSRDAERAKTAANEYSGLAKGAYGNINGTITGKDNLSVANESEILIISFCIHCINCRKRKFLILLLDYGKRGICYNQFKQSFWF